METRPTYYFVFDVESVGFHGVGFAWGAVLIDETGRGLVADSAGTRFPIGDDPMITDREGWRWCWDNLPLGTIPSSSLTPRSMRDRFWHFYTMCQDEVQKHDGKLYVAAECPVPVESNFLEACFADEAGAKVPRQIPYPLIDIASIRLAAGCDPTETCDRLETELPVHNPLADARQSARLMIEALTGIRLSRDTVAAQHEMLVCNGAFSAGGVPAPAVKNRLPEGGMYWRAPVETPGDLPVEEHRPNTIRFVESLDAAYWWDPGESLWKLGMVFGEENGLPETLIGTPGR